LLLGDSFTNIYSVNGLGWGTGAGFAEHLSYHLQRPLDLFARNDSGAYITRELLADELRRGRDRLASKKLVIWQFAERELSQGDWKLIDMALDETPSSSGFYVSQPGKSVVVTGVIAAISRSPEPGAGPYRDNILTMHLVDLQAEGKSLEKSQALVYGWGMQDNKLTDMAAYRAGDTISLTLASWEELESEYGSYRRSSLDDEMIELEIPNWGKLTNE
jgi:alginate O-acetyltransferase complex protein AlgJ